MHPKDRRSASPGRLPATDLLTTRAYVDLMRTASATCLRPGSTCCAG